MTVNLLTMLTYHVNLTYCLEKGYIIVITIIIMNIYMTLFFEVTQSVNRISRVLLILRFLGTLKTVVIKKITSGKTLMTRKV